MVNSLNPKFGPAAQTPEQRARVVQRMQQAIPSLAKQLRAKAPLLAQYVAGELSWHQVQQALERRTSEAL